MNAASIMVKLNKAQINYNGAIDKVEQQISDKIDFEFQIFYQMSDGWVILNVETTDNAPLFRCLRLIQQHGRLTEELYKTVTI